MIAWLFGGSVLFVAFCTLVKLRVSVDSRLMLPVVFGVITVQVFLRLSTNCRQDPFVLVEVMYSVLVFAGIAICLEIVSGKIINGLPDRRWKTGIPVYASILGLYLIFYYLTGGLKIICLEN